MFEEDREANKRYQENLKQQLEQEREKFNTADQQMLQHKKDRITLKLHIESLTNELEIQTNLAAKAISDLKASSQEASLVKTSELALKE